MLLARAGAAEPHNAAIRKPELAPQMNAHASRTFGVPRPSIMSATTPEIVRVNPCGIAMMRVTSLSPRRRWDRLSSSVIRRLHFLDPSETVQRQCTYWERRQSGRPARKPRRCLNNSLVGSFAWGLVGVLKTNGRKRPRLVAAMGRHHLHSPIKEIGSVPEATICKARSRTIFDAEMASRGRSRMCLVEVELRSSSTKLHYVFACLMPMRRPETTVDDLAQRYR